MDGEQKRITLTVPYTEDPLARADGALWDGRDRTGAAKDGRSIAVLHADIGKALLASWPGEPATDYAKRLAEIEAEVARRAKPLPFYYGKVTAVLHEDRRDDLGWLLGQLRATSEALAALGIPDDGRPLAERVGDLGKRLHGAKCASADCKGGVTICDGSLAAAAAEYEAAKPPPPPCFNCGKPSTGGARRVGLDMRFTCSTECCIEIERRDFGDPDDDATIGEDRPCFTGSKEATIAKLAAVDPALAADVARANGYEGDWEERAMNTLDLGDLEAADKARDAARVVYCTRCRKDHAVMPDETPCPDGTWIAKVIG